MYNKNAYLKGDLPFETLRNIMEFIDSIEDSEVYEDKETSDIEENKYVCYLIGMDEYGDKIIKNFMKEDSDYLDNPYPDVVIKYYKSNEEARIEDVKHNATSCVFLIGKKYNYKYNHNYFQNKYKLNVIKILEEKSEEDGDGTFYYNNYNEIISFLRIFTIPIGHTGGLMSELLTDIPGKEEKEFIRFKEYRIISKRFEKNTEEEWNNVFNYIVSNLKEKDSKWMFRIIMPTENDFGLHQIGELATAIENKMGSYCAYVDSGWNKKYYEIVLIYEK